MKVIIGDVFKLRDDFIDFCILNVYYSEWFDIIICIYSNRFKLLENLGLYIFSKLECEIWKRYLR